jgi:hypothetical protein
MRLKILFREAVEWRQIHRLDWRGIIIEIEYRPCWLFSTRRVYGYDLAHLAIRSIDPERAPLPITETGYRSHFTDRAGIEAAGGPVAYVAEALDDAARSPGWLRHEAESRQGDLFG